MPKLVRLYIVNVAIGYALAAVFVALLVWFNIGNLGHLVLETEMGWLAGLMLFVSNGVIFAGAQFAIAVMRQAQDDEGPRGGTRAPVVRRELIPVQVEARAAKSGFPRR
ncbi:hypothetical protein GCM10007291_02120 [Gemmobacter nanjingensis]|uniref:Solute:sodium symporter small subunit n=1 Tax=Gemmobacter nanjingensis TaxID=488454 RepID=A0ABQ3F6N2_9RHOB|nr:hypothetical protein [Gemmobacter nanjingensis]GHC09528.1 hypothetical protein GCM10007291_02120 [Gemmobacter nanjingensis]